MKSPVLCLSLLALFFGDVASQCYRIPDSITEEGFQDLTGSFPWFGLLKVVSEFQHPILRYSGVILVTKSFVISNAEDVVNLPYTTFREKTTVIFTLEENTPAFVKPVKCFIHPEYNEVQTTIALIKLNIDDLKQKNLLPVCWTKHASPTTNLWLMGYVNMFDDIQRMIFEVEIQKKKLNRRKKKNSTELEPLHSIRVKPKRFLDICEWQSGTALISNTTKYYTLVGIGLQSENCDTVPRFIDLDFYYPWAVGIFNEIISSEIKSSALRQHVQSPPELSHLDNTNWTHTYVHLDTPFNDSIMIGKPKSFAKQCKVIQNSINVIQPQIMKNISAEVYKFTLHDLINEACVYIKLRIVGLKTIGYALNYCEVIEIEDGEDSDQEELDPNNTIKSYELYIAFNYDSPAKLVVELYTTESINMKHLDPKLIEEIEARDIQLARLKWKSIHLLSDSIHDMEFANQFAIVGKQPTNASIIHYSNKINTFYDEFMAANKTTVRLPNSPRRN